jgi:hypothetical protein
VGPGKDPEYFIRKALANKIDAGKVQYHLKKPVKAVHQASCLGPGHEEVPLLLHYLQGDDGMVNHGRGL